MILRTSSGQKSVTPMADLAAWDSFYVIVGAAAGALIGLQFVVVTLIAQRPTRASPDGSAAFGTPTVVHVWRAFARKYYADNREKLIAKVRERYFANPEPKRAYARAYRKKRAALRELKRSSLAL